MYQSQIDYIYNIVQNVKNSNIYSKKIKNGNGSNYNDYHFHLLSFSKAEF